MNLVIRWKKILFNQPNYFDMLEDHTASLIWVFWIQWSCRLPTLFSTRGGFIASNCRMMVTDELSSVWKEAVMALIVAYLGAEVRIRDPWQRVVWPSIFSINVCFFSFNNDMSVNWGNIGEIFICHFLHYHRLATNYLIELFAAFMFCCFFFSFSLNIILVYTNF